MIRTVYSCRGKNSIPYLRRPHTQDVFQIALRSDYAILHLVGFELRKWTKRAIAIAICVMLAGFLGFFVYNVATIEDWRIAEIARGMGANDGAFLNTAMLDSAASPHIVYTSRDGIGHAWLDDGKWVTDIHPIYLSDYGVTCCAAMGADDAVHAFVSIASYSGANSTDCMSLFHLMHADGTWTECKIPGLPEFDRYKTSACAVGPNGDIHVLSVGENFSLYAEIEHDLHVVHWHFDGSDWNVSSVLPITGEWYHYDSNFLWIPDMAIDSEGGIHAVASAWHHDIDGVAYISFKNGEWAYEILNLERGSLPRIAMDGNTPVIAVREPEAIVVLGKDEVEWNELARVEYEFRPRFDIAVDDEDALHLVCSRDDGYGRRPLEHTAFKDETGVTRTVHDYVSYDCIPSCELDDEGRAHIGFVGSSNTVSYATDVPDEDALSSAASDAVLKALLVLCVLAAVALMALGVLGLRRLRRWQTDRFNEEPDEIWAKRVK